MDRGPTASAPAAAVLILTRSDVERLLPLADCIEAVEEAFRAAGRGAAIRTGVLGIHADGGGFHAKGALMPGERARFAAKVNANFPENPVRNGLPTIQGVLVLFDAANGAPLAVMDSAALTLLRTAAATAVAARHLARADASVVAIIGCGAQAWPQLEALCVVRDVRQVIVYDRDRGAAEAFAARVHRESVPEVAVADSAEEATRTSDVIVTCTTSRAPFLSLGMIRPGAFIAAVGADNEEKSEIAPALMGAAAVVCDSVEQCIAIGDLHHAVAAGAMTRDAVRAELAGVVATPSLGRRSDDEIIVFDSTGVALEDVAAATLMHERAVRDDAGIAVTLGA